ncbi:MAG: hypothetical protein JXA09_04365, partial [Anaerolineae bacterium]|nr:hypothetical protein [Anaerolineae bacterium]
GIAVSALVTLAYWGLGARLAGIPHLPDSGPSWYYWKLPAPETWARVTAWGFYLLHQFSFWAVIYAAQRQRARVGDGLAPYNIAALAINLFFALLRLLQTHVWYDGLAQDVSIWTSQGSVILMLIMILIMENGRRGLFFGKRVPMPRRAMRLVREYHGYVFAWATVYTFWYHPTEATSGHLIGFFYMFLLFLQGSLAHTRVHVKRGWTLFLEAFVLLHGTLVAVMQGNGLWPMFAFGFGGVLIVTQIWGLGLGRLVKGVLIALYVIAALIVYSQLGWVRLNEIVRIPLIEYALAFVLAWLLGGMAWVARRGWARPAVR